MDDHGQERLKMYLMRLILNTSIEINCLAVLSNFKKYCLININTNGLKKFYANLN